MSGFYTSGLDAISDAEIDYLDDTIAVALLDEAYTFNALHSTKSDIDADILATQNLGTKTRSGGVHSAANTVFTSVAGVDTATGLAIYKSTGVSGTSKLIGYINRRSDTTPFSVETNGDDITIVWTGGIVYTI